MNKKQLSLFIGAFLASATLSAQQITFTNGDSLDVELIQQTDTTLTFSHPFLGKQTVAKTSIRNLQTINLSNLLRVPEGEEGVAVNVFNEAEDAMVPAKDVVDVAKKKVLVAEENVSIANTDMEVEIAEQALVAAEEEFQLAENKLVAAVETADTAEANIKIARDLSVANIQVQEANDAMTAAVAEVKLAKNDISIAEQNVGLAEEALDASGEAGVSSAKANVDHAEGLVDIAEDKLKAANEGVLQAKDTVRAADDQVKLAKGEKVNDGFMGTGWFRDWDSSVSLGLSGSSGSSTNTTFRTAFDTRYEDSEHRWDFKSFYFFDSEDNTASENQINATLVKDWFFADSKWFAFATTVYDWDEFSDWNHRLQLGGGPGYQFIKTEDWEFSARAGLTTIFEFGKTQFDSNDNPVLEPDGSVHEENIVGLEGLVGADVTWHISAKQRFTLSNYLYPSFTDGGKFRNLTNLAWVHDIEWFEGMALKFGIRNEYDTSELIPNEFKYNFSLLWGF